MTRELKATYIGDHGEGSLYAFYGDSRGRPSRDAPPTLIILYADDFDIVAGYRAQRSDPWPRRLLADTWGFIVRGMFGLSVRDIDCAFKLFRREVIDEIEIESIGAFVNTEILVRAEALGYRVHQVPVSHRRRQNGTQSGANLKVILRAVLELATLYRGLYRARRRGNA